MTKTFDIQYPYGGTGTARHLVCDMDHENAEQAARTLERYCQESIYWHPNGDSGRCRETESAISIMNKFYPGFIIDSWDDEA